MVMRQKSVTDSIKSLCLALNKVPCVVNDYPGFIANRILMPMINEAICSLYEGIAGWKNRHDHEAWNGASNGPPQLADFIGPRCLPKHFAGTA